MTDFSPTDPTTAEDVSLISEIARERRERAVTERPRQLPDFVREISQSEVIYTLDPVHLPVANMDVGRLLRLVEEAYGLTLTKPDLAPLLAGAGQREFAEISALSTEQLLARLLRSDGQIAFEKGRMPTVRNDFVPIIRVIINRESVLAAVQGPGDVADLLVRELVELVWVCAGARKTWPDIEPHVQLKGFGTGTLVDFGSFEGLLNPVLADFFDREVVGGRRFGSEVAAHLARNDFKAPADVVVTWAVDDIYLVINRFDPQSGAYDKSRLQFSVITRTGYRTGQVLVSSEMPFDVHIEMLQGLVGALGAASP